MSEDSIKLVTTTTTHQYLRQRVAADGKRDVQDPHLPASYAKTALMSSSVQLEKRQEAMMSWSGPWHKHGVSDLSNIPARRIGIRTAAGGMSRGGGRDVQRAAAGGDGRGDTVARAW